MLKSKNLPDLRRLLVEKLLPWASLHGVLVRIFDLGTLIIGESAVGKSEAALDLVLRGHKLVADDLVILEKKKTRSAADLLKWARTCCRSVGSG